MANWTGFVDWLERARHKIAARDLLWLTPPGVAAVIAGFALGERPAPQQAPAAATRTHPVDLSRRDDELVELAHDLFRAVGRHYFRLEVEGVQHVPASGPVMLVGNHNGAILPLDVLFTMLAVRDHLGPDRTVHPLSHDGIFYHPTVRRYAEGLGVLPASPAAGEAVLDAGRVMLVYPGSDLDAGRPFADRGRVELGGRKGFLRVALHKRVPIIPVVSVGTHEQLIILSRGESIARALRMPSLMRTKTFPIALALPWGLTSALLPYIPLPAQTTVAFGAPITFDDISEADADAAARQGDGATLTRCYERVVSAMQRMLDELSEGRRPLLGKKKPAR
jgi:1-acyl-sn-glycerol-3-phosphate acyltransferase